MVISPGFGDNGVWNLEDQESWLFERNGCILLYLVSGHSNGRFASCSIMADAHFHSWWYGVYCLFELFLILNLFFIMNARNSYVWMYFILGILCTLILLGVLALINKRVRETPPPIERSVPAEKRSEQKKDQDTDIQSAVKYNKEDGAKYSSDFLRTDGAKQTQSGLVYKIIRKGGPRRAVSDKDEVRLHYKCSFVDGTVLEEKDFNFNLDRTIKGFAEGVKLIGEGGRIILVIPSELGNGNLRVGPIPPNTTLVYDVTLNEVEYYDSDI